jgi:hypothetical protein
VTSDGVTTVGTFCKVTGGSLTLIKKGISSDIPGVDEQDSTGRGVQTKDMLMNQVDLDYTVTSATWNLPRGPNQGHQA